MEFDPRQIEDRSCKPADYRAAVYELTNIAPKICLQYMWGISPQPPDFSVEVSVTTTPSYHEQAWTLILHTNCVSQDILDKQRNNYLHRKSDNETVQKSVVA